MFALRYLPAVGVVILCYHKVGPESEEGRFLNIEPRRLAQHIRFFQRRGWQFVQAAELAGGWPARGICLTFDDAYVSACTHGMEVLNREGVPATFYAVSGHVGGVSAWDPGKERPLADWDLLLAAQRSGIEIGNHTKSHADLSQLSPAEQLEEIGSCSVALESSGLRPGSFCYPYGRLNADSRAMLSAAGVTVAVGLSKRIAEECDDRLALPRFPVAFSDSVPLLLYKLFLRPRLPGTLKSG